MVEVALVLTVTVAVAVLVVEAGRVAETGVRAAGVLAVVTVVAAVATAALMAEDTEAASAPAETGVASLDACADAAPFATLLVVVEAEGVRAPEGAATPEFVAQQWASILDMSQARPFANATQALVDTFGPGST